MKFISLKIAILIAIFIAIICINAYYEIFALNLSNGPGIEKAEESLRVMTWNVNASLVTEDVDKVRDGLTTEIEKLNPDILCLQELSPKIFKEIQTSLDSLFGYTDGMVIKGESQRFRLYSRKPIRNFKRYKCVTEIDTTGFDQTQQEEIKIIKRQMPFFSAEIEINPDKWITVFSCHLRSSAYSTARRSMEEGSSWLDGISLYVENYKTGKKIRDYEADNLKIYLDSLELDETPIIIVGDFNDWSGSYCLNTIQDGEYNDSWWEKGFGFGSTYDAWHLKLRLDHILFSPHFDIKNIHVEQIVLSDHYPLVADLYIRTDL